MRMWALGGIFLTVAATGTVAHAQEEEECPMGEPTVLVRNLNAVVGEPPFWISVGREEITWRDTEAHTLFFVRDLEARGPIALTGKNVETGAAAMFAGNSTALTRTERQRLDNLGEQPRGVSEDDLKTYTFNAAAVWFPAAGCYEITAQIGRQTSSVHLQINPPEEP